MWTGISTIMLLALVSIVTAADTIGSSLEQNGIYVCHPPTEQLLVGLEDVYTSPVFNSVKQWADETLNNLISSNTSSVDSISLAVFAPSGDPIYQNQMGQLRSNNTRTVNNDTVYRIARYVSTLFLNPREMKIYICSNYQPHFDLSPPTFSITKIFTALELLHLAENGDLDLDADISEYIPELEYPSPTNTWRARLGLEPAQYNPATRLNSKYKNISSRKSSHVKVTTRQLLGHTSGMLANIYVNQLWSIDPASEFDFIIPNTTSQIFDTIKNNPLTSNPSTWPSYSNIGFMLAGNVIERVYSKRSGQKKSYAEIIKQDILDPLNMTSSYFNIPLNGLENLAVPNGTHSVWSTKDLTVGNSAYGLSSTVGDLIQFGQAILSNYHNDEKSDTLPIEPSTIREWLRPQYAFSDGLTALGLPWEIFYYPPPTQSNDRAISSRGMKMYTKDGSLPGYQSYFMLDPSLQFGAIMMYTGKLLDPLYTTKQIATKFGAAFSEYRETIIYDKTGTYCLSEDTNNSTLPNDKYGSQIVLKVEQGNLWANTWTYRGVDMLTGLKLNDIISPNNTIPSRLSFIPTSEKDIYRAEKGLPPSNHFEGCNKQFIERGAAITNDVPYDLVAVSTGELMMPFAGLRYSKSKC